MSTRWQDLQTAAADLETAIGPAIRPVDATHHAYEERGSQRPAREVGGLGVTPPVGWHWRYLPRHLTLHALAEPNDRMARCGVDERGRGWRGDGSRYERDWAAELAFCSRCMQFIGARPVQRDERGRIAADAS